MVSCGTKSHRNIAIIDNDDDYDINNSSNNNKQQSMLVYTREIGSCVAILIFTYFQVLPRSSGSNMLMHECIHAWRLVFRPSLIKIMY